MTREHRRELILYTFRPPELASERAEQTLLSPLLYYIINAFHYFRLQDTHVSVFIAAKPKVHFKATYDAFVAFTTEQPSCREGFVRDGKLSDRPAGQTQCERVTHLHDPKSSGSCAVSRCKTHQTLPSDPLARL